MTGLLVLWLASGAGAAWFGAPAQNIEASKKLFDAGRYGDVVADLTPAIGRLRGTPLSQAYFYLGSAHERLGHLDDALGVYQLGVKLFPKDINLLTNLGMLLHHTGLEAQAEPIFQKVLAIHPNNAVANLGLAEIDHSLGFFDRSAEHYDKAIEMMADNAAVWRGFSELMLSARSWSTAELAARRALSLAESAEARVDLARAQRGDGRLDEALATLGSAVQAYPKRADLAAMGALWLVEGKRYSEALAAAEALLKAEDPPPLAYWVRARARISQDKHRLAVEDLKRLTLLERKAPFCAAAAKALLAELGAE